MLTLVWKPNAVWREAKAGRVQKNVRRDEGYPPFHSHTGTGTHTRTRTGHTHTLPAALSLSFTPRRAWTGGRAGERVVGRGGKSSVVCFRRPTQASSSSHGSHGQATNQGAVERDAFVLACRHGEEPAAAGAVWGAFPFVHLRGAQRIRW